MRFARYFGRKWRTEDAAAILGEDSLSLTGIFARRGARERARLRKVLSALRSHALAAVKAAASTSDSDVARSLRAIVAALPASLIDASPSWRAPKRISRRTRVAQNAPRVFGRELHARELAVVGILAGVRFTVRKGDTVSDVLTRERNNYVRK